MEKISVTGGCPGVSDFFLKHKNTFLVIMVGEHRDEIQ